jgi:hypothetical protein
MRIGSALALIAVGLILSYAVDFTVPGIDVGTLGAILFFVGLLGLAVTLGLELASQRARHPRAPRRPAPYVPPRDERAYDPVLPRRDRSADPTSVLADPADDRTRRLPRR